VQFQGRSRLFNAATPQSLTGKNAVKNRRIVPAFHPSGIPKPENFERVTTGLENSPDAFIRLMSGETMSTTVVRLSDAISTVR